MSRRPPEYDVCLSAHSAGSNAARVIAKFFRQAGLRVYHDESGEGSPRLWAMHHAVAASRAFLVLLAEGTPPAWAQAELEWGLKRRAMYDDLAVLPVVRAGFEAKGVAGLVDILSPFVLPEAKGEVNNRLRELAGKLRDGLPPARLPVFENEPESARPFTGLRPFGNRNARFFFGRDQEVIEVGQRLGKVHTGQRRWVHVSGPSGVGKSSLVRAGLIPAVHRGVVSGAPADWIVAAVRPERRPIPRLAEALTRALGGDLWVGEALEQLRTDNGLAELVRESMPADKGLLLVIDGLEDLLNGQEEEIRAFDRLLAGAIDDFDERLYLVTTARDDLGQRVMARLPQTARLAAARAAYVELGGPTREGLWEAIVGPVRLAGGRFAEGLAERILDDVERTPDSLPRLGYLLSMVWDRSWEGELTHATYEALGGVAGALGRDAGALIEGLVGDDTRRAKAMLLGMVAVGRGRGDAVRVVSLSECLAAAGGGPKAETVLQTLTNVERGGFVEMARDELDDEAPPTTDEGTTPTVRLAHDTLLRDWPALRAWIEDARTGLERRDDAEVAATMWTTAGGHPDVLPQGDRLKHLEGAELPGPVREVYPTLLNADGRRFLEAARAAERRRDEEHETHRQAGSAAEQAHRAGERGRSAAIERRLRLTIGGLIGLAVLLFALMLSAHSERDELLIQRDTVEAERRRMGQERATLETEKLAVEKQRLEIEGRFRDSERGRRAAGRESARAGQTADELLRISLEIGTVADDTIKRIQGEASKYARRVVNQAVAKRMQEAMAAAPENEFLRYALSRQLEIQGDLFVDQKQPRSAITSYEQSAAHLDRLALSPTPLPKYFECLARVQTSLGEIYRREPQADAEKAQIAYAAALNAHAKLAELEPDVDDHVAAQGDLQRRLHRIHVERADAAGARKSLDAALAHYTRLSEKTPPAAAHQFQRAQTLADLAEVEFLAGAADAARPKFEAALEATLATRKTPENAGELTRLEKRIRVRLKAR